MHNILKKFHEVLSSINIPTAKHLKTVFQFISLGQNGLFLHQMRIFKLKGTLRPEQAGKIQISLHISVQADHSLPSCHAQSMKPGQFMKYHAKTKQSCNWADLFKN